MGQVMATVDSGGQVRVSVKQKSDHDGNWHRLYTYSKQCFMKLMIKMGKLSRLEKVNTHQES